MGLEGESSMTVMDLIMTMKTAAKKISSQSGSQLITSMFTGRWGEGEELKGELRNILKAAVCVGYNYTCQINEYKSQHSLNIPQHKWSV